MNDSENYIPKKSRCSFCNRPFMKLWENHIYCKWQEYVKDKGKLLLQIAEEHQLTQEEFHKMVSYSHTRSLTEIQQVFQNTTYEPCSTEEQKTD